MKRERGTGSLRVRGGVFWLRYYHHGKRVEESSGIRRTCECTGREARCLSDAPNHGAALKKLRAQCKVADTPSFVAPSASKVTFEELCALLKVDYARKGRRSARRLEGEHGPLGHLGEAFAGRRAPGRWGAARNRQPRAGRVAPHVQARAQEGHAANCTRHRAAA